MPTVSVEVVNKGGKWRIQGFFLVFVIQERITKLGEIILKRQCIKRFHIPRCSGVVLDASCIAPDFVRLPPYGPGGQRQARRSGDRSTQ